VQHKSKYVASKNVGIQEQELLVTVFCYSKFCAYITTECLLSRYILNLSYVLGNTVHHVTRPMIQFGRKFCTEPGAHYKVLGLNEMC
jgi:hypothetical protein